VEKERGGGEEEGGENRGGKERMKRRRREEESALSKGLDSRAWVNFSSAFLKYFLASSDSVLSRKCPYDKR